MKIFILEIIVDNKMNAIACFDGAVKGSVSFHQCQPGVATTIDIKLSGFADRRPKAIHIHTYGDLSRGCDSAEGHYNPGNRKHGNFALHGKDRHVGDMINNLYPSSNGAVRVIYQDDLIDLYGKNSVIGRMVVIHAGEDDLGVKRDTDKGSATTGNAGGRIGCAVIGLSAPAHF